VLNRGFHFQEKLATKFMMEVDEDPQVLSDSQMNEDKTLTGNSPTQWPKDLLSKYFEELNDNLLRRCKLCKFSKFVKATKTFNLKRHLENLHTDALDELKKEEDRLKMRKVENSSVVIKKKVLSAAGQSKITDFIKVSHVMKLCGRVVVEDGRPFSNFDSEPMQEILKLGKKNANDFTKTPINRETVRTTVREDARSKRTEIMQKLKDKVIHLSSDMATAEGRSFFGLNAQFFDDVTKTIAVVNLVCLEVKEKHSAANIRGWIKEALIKFDIKEEQLLSISIGILYRNLIKHF